MKYAVKFERARGNWAAYVPDLPGCISTGETLAEAREDIRETVKGHLETLRAFGDPIPEPASLAEMVDVQWDSVWRRMRV